MFQNLLLRLSSFCSVIILSGALLFPQSGIAQESTTVRLDINTRSGHPIEIGASGYNVRIADKVWNFTHPDFLAAVDTLRPGWLRYFSGTMGDAFNCATGLYDYDYAWMFSKQRQYTRGYEFTSVKGPHRVYDLYQALGRVGGKLLITVNAFSETPDVAGEMARFCRNHHIEVEGWQFCNEPYFYVPHRNRYWWNDGYDYARKMKPYATAIRSVDPSAKLALNYTWDGIWGFMKEINQYQTDHGRYWDVFSKHSYAPHIGGSEEWETGYPRANTKLPQVTSPAAMQQIEAYTWEGAPLLITEFSTWNRALSGVFTGLYNAEYTLRQLAHPNAWLIGSHEISSNAFPARDRNKELLSAFQNQVPLDTDTLRTGVRLSPGGKAMRMLHQITSQTDYTWEVDVEGGPMVPGMRQTELSGMYARAFRGTQSKDWLVVINRSAEVQTAIVSMDGEGIDHPLTGEIYGSENPNDRSAEVVTINALASGVSIPAYSMLVLGWEHGRQVTPPPTRIFEALVAGPETVKLSWWQVPQGQKYLVKYGHNPDDLDQQLLIDDASQHSTLIKNLQDGKMYTFEVTVLGDQLASAPSTSVSLNLDIPAVPTIFKQARRNNTATIWWRSVADATGYRVYARDHQSGELQIFDAQATFGYRIEGLTFDRAYDIWVTAYNGMGESASSPAVSITPKAQLPIPPRNISAIETQSGSVQLKWIVQDSINPGVKYRLFRGTELHVFEPIADEIIGNTYLDQSIDASEQLYFYTIKAYNEAGETNFYPNIATVISSDKEKEINITSIVEEAEKFMIEVQFKNIPLDGDVYGGITLSDISYLTVEEEIIRAEALPESASSGTFLVEIPTNSLAEGHSYVLKGFVNTNGQSIYSAAPHKQVKRE